MRKPITLLTLALIGSAAGAVLAESVPVTAPSRLASGYLGADRMPDDLALLPLPPAVGSRALKRDHDAEIGAALMCRSSQLVAGLRVLPFK